MPHLISYPEKHDASFLPSWNSTLSDREEHVAIAGLVSGIEGKLYDEDAMKLYELASFTPGPILEIGVFRGRSTTVMARALKAAGNPARIISVDIDSAGLAVAAENLARHAVSNKVTLVEGTSRALLRAAPSLRPGLVFVDGDHSFRGALADLEAIEPFTPTGSIVVMHDYEGYTDDDPYWIQVEPAVQASWLVRDARFIGRFGLSGVFLRISGGPSARDLSHDEPVRLVVERSDDPLVKVRRRASRAIDYRRWTRRRGR